jgi:DNA-3-methyladenine glycosylase II
LSELVFRLSTAAPFRLDLTAWALRRRPENKIDVWDGTRYRRTILVEQKPILIAVQQIAPPEAPRLEITAVSKVSLAKKRDAIAAVISRTLGLEVDLSPFYELAEGDATLGKMVQRFAGFRPPRFPTVFEALINAIACQQLSLTVGIIVLNRVANEYGCHNIDGAPLTFPSPQLLAHAEPLRLRELGLSRQKAAALIGIAQRLSLDPNYLDDLEALEDAAAFERFLSMRGIGRWSAEYAMLRGLGRLNVFPGDDIAGQKNLQRWLGLRNLPSYERVRRLLAHWSPYAGLLYFHFLLSNLEARGFVTGAA